MDISQPNNQHFVELEGRALTLMRATTLIDEIQLLKNTFPLSLATVEAKASLAAFRKGYYDFIDLLPAVVQSHSIDLSKNSAPYSSGFLTVLHDKCDALLKILPQLEKAMLLLPVSFRERIAFLVQFGAIPLAELSTVKFDRS